MARSGRKAVKVLILTPLITMALALVMLLFLVLSVVFQWNSADNFFMLSFEYLGLFSVTAGLLMTIVGVILAIKQKTPLYIVLGSLMIIFMLVVDSWLYWLAFVNEADTKGPIDAFTRQTELTEDAELPQHVYETPEIVLVKVEDNTKRIREGSYDGPPYVYYLFDKNGDVYRLDDPDIFVEELPDKYSDGSLSDELIFVLTIEDKNGLQKCFDKLQLIFNNSEFKLTEPLGGPDWSQKDITWYGLYYDEDNKLQTKTIYFIGDLESRFITNDQNADDIVNWLETYVPNGFD